MSLRIGIDIGGTKVLAGVVEDGRVVRVALMRGRYWGRAPPVSGSR